MPSSLAGICECKLFDFTSVCSSFLTLLSGRSPAPFFLCAACNVHSLNAIRACYTFRFHSNKHRHKFTVTFPFRTSSCSCLIVWRARSFIRTRSFVRLLTRSLVLHVNVHGLTGEQGYNCSSFYSLHSASPVSAMNMKSQPLYPN